MIIVATASAHTTASAKEIFSRWADHATWPEWDTDTEWVQVFGPVREGTHGTLKTHGGPTVNFVISTFEPDREYTDTSALPGAKLVFQHLARQTENGTEVNAQVTLTGPLSKMWAIILGKNFRATVPAALDRLIKLVEK